LIVLYKIKIYKLSTLDIYNAKNGRSMCYQ